jgi:hypothetical protein
VDALVVGILTDVHGADQGDHPAANRVMKPQDRRLEDPAPNPHNSRAEHRRPFGKKKGNDGYVSAALRPGGDAAPGLHGTRTADFAQNGNPSSWARKLHGE